MDISVLKAQVIINLPQSSQGNGRQNLIEWLQEIMCYHQGTIIEHVYWGAELHKELRTSLQDDNLLGARNKFNDINNDLPELFKSAWKFTVLALNNYFPAVHKCVCVISLYIQKSIK
jgi:hypothetical protein|tara:strand:- start:189 stop:539 length:351 start_codon:yes stop_codon:yes gene_type:complete